MRSLSLVTRMYRDKPRLECHSCPYSWAIKQGLSQAVVKTQRTHKERRVESQWGWAAAQCYQEIWFSARIHFYWNSFWAFLDLKSIDCTLLTHDTGGHRLRNSWRHVPLIVSICYCGHSSQVSSDRLTLSLTLECASRWRNHLDSNINHSEWTEDEDQCLLNAFRIYGSNWKMIQFLELSSRSTQDIRNRYV